jgi:hypothetical protein
MSKLSRALAELHELIEAQNWAQVNRLPSGGAAAAAPFW